jgi:protocatechuate 3,4-dioxygenase beta subunit
MKKLAATLFVATSLVWHAAAQTPKPSARIRGRVVAAATGRPLLLATVTLSGGNPSIQRTAKTDSNGSYEFANLPAGRYSFAASRAGYLEQHFDQPNPLARYRLLELADGEVLDGMDFRLHRGAVITGVITDEAGDPLPDAWVQVMREQFGPAGRSLIPEMRTPVPIRTDDEGRYRVYALRPGMYAVKATTDRSDDPSLSFGRTYYPGTMNESEAQMVRVDVEQDAVANFSMIPARRARLSGAVRDSEGRPASGMRVTLGESNGPRFDQVAAQMVSADGNFTFEHMLPGRYLVHVRPSAAQRQTMPAQVEWGALHVNLSGEDISDLVLTTSHGFAISGRVTFDRSAIPPAAKVTVAAREMDFAVQSMGLPPTITNNPVDATGRFTIVGVRGKVRVTGGGAGWYTKKVLVRGVDVTSSGFDVNGDFDGIEVILTSQVTTITGSVRDARGIGRNDFIVTFFPAGQFESSERASRQRTIRPDPDGVYRIRNLPPGDYLAAAVPALSLPIDGEWDPAFLEKVKPSAIGFKLAEGQSLALNLPLTE